MTCLPRLSRKYLSLPDALVSLYRCENSSPSAYISYASLTGIPRYDLATQSIVAFGCRMFVTYSAFSTRAVCCGINSSDSNMTF